MWNRYVKRASLIILLCLAVISCTREEWKDHYDTRHEQVDMKIWDAVKEEPRYSKFVEYMEEYQLDSLFELDQFYTLFIPDNDALEAMTDTAGPIDKTLANHISRTVFLTSHIGEIRKLQVLNGKFAVIEQSATGYTFEGVAVEYSSPLYLDGKYFEIARIAYPKLNLYEFTELFSRTIRWFIDANDSVYLDKTLSTPISFDDKGRTIYDSVFSVVNTFERDFFPVSQELRDKSATFILFTQGQYNHALDEMAGMLGPGFNSHEDIPEVWQYEVLLPDAMVKSLFDNDLEYTDLKEKMVSVTGDTVKIDPGNINPDSKYKCSNGTIYTYYDYAVPKELFEGTSHIEGEEMIDSIGAGRFAWNEYVTLCGEDPYIVEPQRGFSRTASEDLYVTVTLPRTFSGEYCLEIHFKNLFPRKYRLVYRASFRPSGYYAIYVNGEMIGEFDTFYLRDPVYSVTGEIFVAVEGYNIKDWWVENITEFGDVTVRFEYLDPGLSTSNGFNIDYIQLVPVLE
jgi:hypothetical protein